MCGRIIQSSGPLRLAIVEGLDVSDSRMGNVPPRYNAAPSQELLVIRQNHKTGECSLDLIKWGLIPNRCQDLTGGRKPINAKAESVAKLPTFREAFAQRRCIVPVDGFLEWRAMKGAVQAALCNCAEGWLAFWSGGTMGELAQSQHGEVGTHLCYHHGAIQRTGRANPRPDACDP